MAESKSGFNSKTLINLSVPSVILADDAAEEEMTEAAEEEMTPWYDTGVVWYGSLRGVVSSGGDKDASSSSGSSRWGIKGSSEVSEGLTAVYQFETRLGQGDGSQDTNVLYAGLSGGFGSLTVGKFNNAAYLSGAMRDVGNAFGGGDVKSKVGSTVSYAYATEAFNLQADAIMDGGKDTGKSIDEVQFGMVVNLGDFGKVALGYENREDSMADGMAVKGAVHNAANSRTKTGLAFTPADGIKGMDGSAWNKADGNKAIVEGKVSNVKYMIVTDDESTDTDPVSVMAVEVMYNKASNGSAPTATEMVEMDGDNYYSDACGTAKERGADGVDCTGKAYVLVSTKVEAPDEDETVGMAKYTVHTVDNGESLSATATVTPTKTTYGHKASHITAAFGLGAVTVRLGHTSNDSNDPMMTAKAKTNYLGFTGSIGDTGMDWRAFGRNNGRS